MMNVMDGQHWPAWDPAFWPEDESPIPLTDEGALSLMLVAPGRLHCCGRLICGCTPCTVCGELTVECVCSHGLWSLEQWNWEGVPEHLSWLVAVQPVAEEEPLALPDDDAPREVPHVEPVQATPSVERDTFCVYVIRSHSGQPLYVGQSIKMPARVHQHSREKPWWTEVANVEVWHFESFAAMDTAEARLIRDLRPTYNRVIPRVRADT